MMADHRDPATSETKPPSPPLAASQSTGSQHVEGDTAGQPSSPSTVRSKAPYPSQVARASVATLGAAGHDLPDEEAPLQIFWINFSESWLAVFGLALFGLIIAAAIFAPRLSL